jgi:UDP-2,3-diacylglucosamine hydrolase
MYYFISDCHFRASIEDAHRITRLLEFFETIRKNGRALFLLGDLFEFGFEYRRAIPKSHFRVLSGLYGLVRSNIPVHYLKGNHEIGQGDFLKTELGIAVLDSPVSLTLDGKRVFLSHGDEADTSIAHRLSQKILRSRFNIFCFSLLHPDLGIRLAESIALGNRKRGVSKREVLADYAREKINDGYEVVILGHTHTPVLEPIGPGYYLNTGDWITNYSYGVLADGIPRIERFAPNNE